MPRPPISHRRKVLYAAIGAMVLVILGGVLGFVLLLSGAYSTAATKQHFAITYEILDLGLRYSVAAYADDIEVPPLDDARDIRRGLACYRQHCIHCHGAPGVARDQVGKGMLPSPSSLSQSAREWPAAHLYYVTKKGVRMTGMPAWEFRMSDQALWSTVAFLKAMPNLERQAYESLAAAAHDETCPPQTDRSSYSKAHAQTLLRQYACDNCHQMEGMAGPDTYVGPSLREWHRRRMIAGILPNTPENLARWIMNPQSVSPQTLMPDLGVHEAHAQVMVRYLFGEQHARR